jgi:hypothetical protein
MPQQRWVMPQFSSNRAFGEELGLRTRAAHFQENALSREWKSSWHCFAAENNWSELRSTSRGREQRIRLQVGIGAV